MEEMTMEQARDGFSTPIARSVDGPISECVIKDRSKLVARIVPITTAPQAPRRPFGVAHEQQFLADDDAFDALDEEMAEEFGLRHGDAVGHPFGDLVPRRLRRMPARARELVEDPANEVFVSDVSVWEVAIKHVRRPDVMPRPCADLIELCDRAGFLPLPVGRAAVVA